MQVAALIQIPKQVPEVLAVQKLDADFLASAKFTPPPYHPRLCLAASVRPRNKEYFAGPERMAALQQRATGA